MCVRISRPSVRVDEKMKPATGKIYKNSAHEKSLYCGNHKPSICKEKRTLELEKEDLNKLCWRGTRTTLSLECVLKSLTTIFICSKYRTAPRAYLNDTLSGSRVKQLESI